MPIDEVIVLMIWGTLCLTITLLVIRLLFGGKH